MASKYRIGRAPDKIPATKQTRLLYLPTQIRFPIGGKRVTCRGSKLTNSLWRKKLTNSLGKQQHNFRLARDQVVLLETAATLRASPRKVNDFFAFFFLVLSWEV